MTLKKFALRYHTYSKEDLRSFDIQRLILSGREYRKSSKPELVKRLHRLDEIATFRLMDLPPELREKIYEYAFIPTKSLMPLMLASKQIREEAEPVHWRKVVFSLSICARTLPIPDYPKWDMKAMYHGRTQEFRMSYRTIDDYLNGWPDMFCNVRILDICIELCWCDDVPFARMDNVAGNRTLFYLCAFYTLQVERCHLQTVKVYPSFHEADYMNKVGLTNVLKVIWPLKLLESSLDIDISGFPEEVVRAFSQEVSSADKTMMEATKSFATTFLVRDEEEHIGMEARMMCISCALSRPKFKKESMLLSRMYQYIGPDSASDLKAWIEEVDALEHPVCNHHS